MKVKFIQLLMLIVSVSCSVKNQSKVKSDYELEFVKEINFEEFGNISALIGDEENYFIADWNTCFIYKYDKEDNLINKFGGKGNAPGQFSKLTDIFLTKDKMIYATDQNKNIVTIFNIDGTFIRTLKTKYANIGIAVKENKNIVVSSLSPEYAIYEYNDSGEIVSVLNEIGRSKDPLSLIIQNVSRFTIHNNDVYRVLFNSTKIFKMDSGKITEVFDNQKVNSFEKASTLMKDNVAVFNRGSIVHSNLIFSDDKIYLTGGGGDPEQNENNKINHFLNIYDENWKLLFSGWNQKMEFEAEGYAIYKNGNKLYFAKQNDATLFVFNLRQ